MDEDINFDNPASQLAEGRDKMGISGVEKKSLSTDEALNKLAALSERNATLGILNKRNDMKAPDAALISISSPSFLSSSDSQSPEVVAPSFGLNKSKESSGDKVPALLFSSSFPLSGLKPESSSRLVPTLSNSKDMFLIVITFVTIFYNAFVSTMIADTKLASLEIS